MQQLKELADGKIEAFFKAMVSPEVAVAEIDRADWYFMLAGHFGVDMAKIIKARIECVKLIPSLRNDKKVMNSCRKVYLFFRGKLSKEKTADYFHYYQSASEAVAFIWNHPFYKNRMADKARELLAFEIINKLSDECF